jgi:hypothetical protein
MEYAIDESMVHADARRSHDRWRARIRILERNGFKIPPSKSSVDVNRSWRRAREIIRRELTHTIGDIETAECGCRTFQHDRELRARREVVHATARELWKVW